MAESFDPKTIPPQVYGEQIAKLEARLQELEEQAGRVRAELEWWSRGRALFAPQADIVIHQVGRDPAVIEAKTDSGAAHVNGGDPYPFPVGDRPPLREAIKIVMREGDRNGWRARDLLEALKERKWEPGGKTPADSIGAMLAGMRKQRQVYKLEPGLYSLTPPAQLVPDDGGEP